MLVQAVLDLKSGATPFTAYLWFLAMVLLAASFGSTLETSGAFYASVTEVCNGMQICTSVSASNDFPCADMKSTFQILLPLNIVAFILAFFMLGAHLAIMGKYSNEVPVVCQATALVIHGLTLAEAVLALYVHLAPLCVYPGREAEGLLAIRHGMAGMELGPTFTLLVVSFICQIVASVWVNRDFFRDNCSCFSNICQSMSKRLARAKAAQAYREKKDKEQRDLNGFKTWNNEIGGGSAAPAAADGGGHEPVKPASNQQQAYNPLDTPSYPPPPPPTGGYPGFGGDNLASYTPSAVPVAVPPSHGSQYGGGAAAAPAALTFASGYPAMPGDSVGSNNSSSSHGLIPPPGGAAAGANYAFSNMVGNAPPAAAAPQDNSNNFDAFASNSSYTTGAASSGPAQPHKPFALQMLEKKQKKQEAEKRAREEAAAASAVKPGGIGLDDI